jgi:hypothetical protein
MKKSINEKAEPQGAARPMQGKRYEEAFKNRPSSTGCKAASPARRSRAS